MKEKLLLKIILILAVFSLAASCSYVDKVTEKIPFLGKKDDPDAKLVEKRDKKLPPEKKTASADSVKKSEGSKEGEKKEVEEQGFYPSTSSGLVPDETGELPIGYDPKYISYEYFQKKPKTPGTLYFPFSGKGSKEQEEKQKLLEERIEKLEEELEKRIKSQQTLVTALPTHQKVEKPFILKNKIAFINLEPYNKKKVEQFRREPSEVVASELQKLENLVYIEDVVVKKVIDNQHINLKNPNFHNISLLLGEFLGTQIIVFLEETSAVSDKVKDKVGVEVNLKGKIYDCTTGNLVTNFSVKGFESPREGKEDFMKMEALIKASSDTAKMVEKKVGEYDFSSRIALIDKENIFIHSGKRSGLMEGDVLKVYNNGKEIINPATKLSMGVAPGEYKGKIKIVAFFGNDAAVCKLMEGGSFSINDLVKFENERNPK